MPSRTRSQLLRIITASGVVALAATTLPSALASPIEMTSVAAVGHTVFMGAVDPALPDTAPRPPATAGRSDRFEYLAYYPDHLRVHRGDTVRFRRVGFHTVTFSPPGEARRGWLRRDEQRGVTAVEFRDPSPSCGHDPSVPPCVLSDTSQVLSSGWDDLAVKMDLGVGTYEYYCAVHEGMQGAVEVVPTAQAVDSPEQIARARAERVAADTATAAAHQAANQTPAVAHVGEHLRWTVKAGDITDDQRVAILRYMPSTLQIAPGDQVVFAVPPPRARPAGRVEDATELHTATFPHDPALAPFGLLRYLNPACDPDNRRSGRSGVPAQYPSLIAGCPPRYKAELLLHPWAWRSPMRARRNAVLTPATVHDTGLMAPANDVCRTACDPWSGARFPDRGPTTAFPNAGTFSFVCLVHPEWGMAGSITVSE